MATYRITFRVRPGVRRLLLDVEADEHEQQRHGDWHVLWRYTLVVDRPRRVVVVRVAADDVVAVEQLCGPDRPTVSGGTRGRPRGPSRARSASG